MPQLRACSRCGNPTADGDFSAGRGVCKRCERARNNARYSKRRDKAIAYVLSRRNYKQFYEHSRRTPELLKKDRCRDRFLSAIYDGRIKRPTLCEQCGAGGKIQGHHHDYDKPFDVEWLCTTCHGKQHRKDR